MLTTVVEVRIYLSYGAILQLSVILEILVSVSVLVYTSISILPSLVRTLSTVVRLRSGRSVGLQVACHTCKQSDLENKPLSYGRIAKTRYPQDVTFLAN